MTGKLITLGKIIGAWGVHTLSHLSFRNPQIWICIGWHSNTERDIFADNAKYFFLYISQTQEEITSIWIVKNRKLSNILRQAGYRSYSIYSIQGIYYSLRAGYTFIDAFMERIHWQYSGGSKIIQLWHGKGMKKTGHDSPYSLSKYNKYIAPNLFTKFYKLIASSPYTAKLMTSTFKAPLTDILITGLPRNDVLFNTIPGSEIDENPDLRTLSASLKNSSRRILYAPTFRPNGSNPVDTLDLSLLNNELEKHNEDLIISLHPKFGRKDWVATTAFNRIHFIQAGYDAYPFLKDVDVLITDYSSLYVDYLLLNRPIVFYTYDIETYKIDMGLHEDFDRLTPGAHVMSCKELISALYSKDDYEVERESVRKELFTYNDGEASKRIVTELLKD